MSPASCRSRCLYGHRARGRCRRKKWSGRGRPPKLTRRDGKHEPISVKQLALGPPKRAWRTVKWREGAAEHLCTRFARMRVRVAHCDYNLTEGRPEERRLTEKRTGQNEPTKYWLSTLPVRTSPSTDWLTSPNCVGASSATINDLKQELGVSDFVGRGRRDLSSSCHAVHRGLRISDLPAGPLPPSRNPSPTLFPELAVPDGYRPRGSALAADRHRPQLRRNHAPAIDRRARQKPAAMSVLQRWRSGDPSPRRNS